MDDEIDDEIFKTSDVYCFTKSLRRLALCLYWLQPLTVVLSSTSTVTKIRNQRLASRTR